jgi:hypothetical protein
MKESYLDKYLMLRLVVGYLGEKSQFGWWTTSFFDSSSKLFLDPVFPKTRQLAQYQGVSEAARRLHDEFIGIGNVFHLFRLPEEIEQDLHREMQENRPGEHGCPELKSKDDAMHALSTLAGGIREAKEGPIAIGKISNIFTSAVLKGVAQSYLGAFEQGIRTYPYFIG